MNIRVGQVNIPLPNLGTINPVTMRENPPEKYIQVVSTIDGHDFWFMGFVSFDTFEKATHHLLESLFNFRAAEHRLLPPPPVASS